MIQRRLSIRIEPKNPQAGEQPAPSSAFNEAIKLIMPLLDKGGTGGQHEIHHTPSRGEDATYTDYLIIWNVRDTTTRRL